MVRFGAHAGKNPLVAGYLASFSSCPEKPEKHRQDEERQESRSRQPADHDHGQWPLDLRARPLGEEKRRQAQDCDQGRHQDGAKPETASSKDRLPRREADLAELR
jgi:hypothetical protein